MRSVALRWSVCALSTCCAVAVAALPARGADEATASRAYYEAGAKLYEAGQFDQAIAAFKEAYARSKAPGLLFNLAQAHRRKGDTGCQDALEYYTRYAAEMPGLSAVEKGEVDDRIVEMRSCAARVVTPAVVEATLSVTAAQAPAPRNKSFARRHWWIFPVTGAVLLGVGLGVGLGLHYAHGGNHLDCNGTILCIPPAAPQ